MLNLEIAESTTIEYDVSENGSRRYRIVDATFGPDSTTEVESDSLLYINLEPPATLATPRLVVLYGDFNGRWFALESWIVRRPLDTSVSSFFRSRGFNSEPLDIETSPLKIGKAAEGEALVSVQDLPVAEAHPHDPVTLVFDKQNQRTYQLNLFNTLADARLLNTVEEPDLVDLFAQFSKFNKRRQITYVRRDGTVQHLRGDLTGVHREVKVDVDGDVVKARKGKDTDTYLITVRGSIYRVPDTFRDIERLPIVDVVSDYCPHTGECINILGKALGELPDHLDYYEIKDGYAYGLDIDRNSFKVKTDTKEISPLGAVADHRVPHTIDYDLVEETATTYGNSDITLASGTFSVTPEYVNVLAYARGNFKEGDGIVFGRVVPSLNHFSLLDFGSTVVTEPTVLGDTVKFKVQVTASDKTMMLPIGLPEGVEWIAHNQEGVQVAYALDGDEITIEAKHDFITKNAFPVTIGLGSALIESTPDFMPDSFYFTSKDNLTEGQLYTTNTVVLSGFNQPLELNVASNSIDPDIEVYVDEALVEVPYEVYEGMRVKLVVKHTQPTTNFVVTVGEFRTDFYTTSEELPSLTTPIHRAYVPLGLVLSSSIRNTGSKTVEVLLQDPDSWFYERGQSEEEILASRPRRYMLNGGKDVHIARMVRSHAQSSVVYSVGSKKYTWRCWSDATLLDLPPLVDSAPYLANVESKPYTQSNVPVDMMAVVRIPSGCNAYVNGTLVGGSFDARGYRQTSKQLAIYPGRDEIVIHQPADASPAYLDYGDVGVEFGVTVADAPEPSAAPASMFTSFQLDFHAAGSQVNAAYDIHGPRHVLNASPMKNVSKPAHTFQPRNAHVAVGPALRTRAVNIADRAITGFHLRTVDHYLTQAIASFADSYKSNYHENAVPRFLGNEQYLPKDRNTFREVPLYSTLTHAMKYKLAERGTRIPMGGVNPRPIQITAIAMNKNIPVYYPITEYWSEYSKTPNWIAASEDLRVVASTPRHVNQQIGTIAQYGYRHINAQGLSLSVAEGKSNPAAEPMLVDAATSRSIQTYAYNSVNVSIPQRTFSASLYPVEVVYANVKFNVNRSEPLQGVASRLGVTYPHAMIPQAVSQSKAIYSVQSVPRWVHFESVFEEIVRLEFVWRPRSARPLRPMVGPKVVNVPVAGSKTSEPAEGNVRNEVNVASGLSQSYVLSPAVPVTSTKPRFVDANVQSAEYARTARFKPVERHTLPLPSFETKLVNFNEGETDPLKNGYFETELLALQNAKDVWGYEAGQVYGIEHPEGYWTWAIAVPCGETCGSLSCDARGYLSGG